CGNDITSSCLYVSAIAILYAGRWAPVCLLLVAATLYLFRSIYAEVVGALPLNGGAYNALLNTTSKFRASVAACLTILSYMATAVISSNEAMHYLHGLWHTLPIIWATIGLLAFFMVLTIIGITESSKVAIVIFVVHLGSMALLLILGAFALIRLGPETLWMNLRTPAPNGIWAALFFGFSAAMLGVSGFESSANFVEEQQPGVFPKTLRNMWIAVAILNPGMALLALSLVPTPEVGALYKENLLSHIAVIAGGGWLEWLISVDALLVLSGATLTSFVGVCGLVERMTLDRCLPQFLLKKSRRGTSHRIIILFFLLAVSVLLITGGKIESLAAVYTLSFLLVMLLFAIGNVLLKMKRARLPRPDRASWLTVLVAMGAVATAIIGNAKIQTEYVIVFFDYFVPAMLIIMIMLGRLALLKILVYFMDEIRRGLNTMSRNALRKNDVPRAGHWLSLSGLVRRIDRSLHDMMQRITNRQLVFFTRGDNVVNLHHVMQYIKENEHTRRVKIVTVVNDPEEDVPPLLAGQIRFLDEVYPDIDMEFIVLQGTFNPALIEELSQEWNIPKNLMFIGSPGDHFPFGLEDMGGVRLII
ncbi:MAG: APC family permease, partial [Phycisphaerales bacterium]|nr:APC family permease [Phycisphaerales bacterium]